MKKLHSTQQDLLKLLQKNVEDPLSVRELQEHLGISSPSVVHHHIQQLEKKGFLRRNPTNPKDYQILADSPEKQITYINLYGQAQCGPKGSLLDSHPIDRIPIASRLLGFKSSEAFMVKAKGDSMTPKIQPGDYVIVRKTHDAHNGDIIVCVNKGEVLIKKIQKSPGQVILSSLNSEAYPPFTANRDFRIEGVVKGVISYSMGMG